MHYKYEDLNEEQKKAVDKQLKRKPDEVEKKKNKYNAQHPRIDGIRFDSNLEARYYEKLKLLVKAGKLLFFLRQVPIGLPGNIKYRVDFLEFWPDGTYRFVDVKGIPTPMFIIKKKQVEELYPIEIEIEK